MKFYFVYFLFVQMHYCLSYKLHFLLLELINNCLYTHDKMSANHYASGSGTLFNFLSFVLVTLTGQVTGDILSRIECSPCICIHSIHTVCPQAGLVCLKVALWGFDSGVCINSLLSPTRSPPARTSPTMSIVVWHTSHRTAWLSPVSAVFLCWCCLGDNDKGVAGRRMLREPDLAFWHTWYNITYT